MKDKRPLSLTYFLLILAMLFYGISFISTKILLESYGPVAIVWLRLIVSTCLLFLIDRRGGKSPKIARSDLKYFLILALFQPFLYFLCETYGLNMVSPSITSIIIATIPVFTPLAAVPLLKEKVTPAMVGGLVLSFAGVGVIVLGDLSSPSFSVIGIILIFGAVLAAVGYTVFTKKIPMSYSTVTIVRYQNLFGLIYFLPLFILLEAPKVVSTPIAVDNLFHLIFLAFLPSTASFIFLSHAIRTIGPSKSNVFTNTIPVYTALLSFFFLGEAFSLYKVGGILIVMAGVFLSQKKNRPAPAAPGALPYSGDEQAGLPG